MAKKPSLKSPKIKKNKPGKAPKPPKAVTSFSLVREKVTLSRVFGNEWYSCVDKDLVLHVYEDQNHIESAVYFKPGRRWYSGPTISMSELYDSEKLVEILKTLLLTPDGVKAKGIALIVHSGRDHHITSPRENLQEEESLRAMKEKTFPTEFQSLSDPEKDNFIWRLAPLFSVENRLARMPVLLPEVFNKMPEELFSKPVSYSIRNTFLDAVTLVHVLSHLRKKDEEAQELVPDGKMTIFYYDQVSIMVLQDKEGDPINIRPFPHMQNKFSRDLPQAVFRSISDEERVTSVELRMFNMGQTPMADMMQSIIDAAPDDFVKKVLIINFETPEEVGMTLAEQLNQEKGDTLTPVKIRPDYFIHDIEKLRVQYQAPVSMTYKRLKPMVSVLDFSQRKPSTVTRMDISLLLAGQALSMLIILMMFALGGYKLWDIYKSMTSEEWQLPPAVSEESKLDLQKVSDDFTMAKKWESVFIPRSKAWHQMEFISNLFPEGSGFQVDSVVFKTSYSDTDESWKRIWTIQGITDDKGNNYFRDLDVQKGFPKFGPYKLSNVDWTTQSLLENDANLILNRRSKSDAEQEWKKSTAQKLDRPYNFTYESNLLKGTQHAFTLKVIQEISAKDPFSL